jgi:hypothetical protein
MKVNWQKIIFYLPYAILYGLGLLGILFPDFFWQYEFPLIIILPPLAIFPYLKSMESKG